MMDKIIDCHMHFSAKGIFNKTAENIGLKCTLEEVQNEFKKNNIVVWVWIFAKKIILVIHR